MKKRFTLVFLFVALVGVLRAQTNLPEAIKGIQEMLLSTASYSADLQVYYYDKENTLSESEQITLFKSDDVFYRLSKGNETILTKENYLKVNHQRKQLLLLPSQVEQMTMVVMGFDSSWLQNNDLGILSSERNELKIKVSNHKIYKEVIYTFDTTYYYLKEVDYIYPEGDIQDYSHIHVVYENTKHGKEVDKNSPVEIGDYLRLSNGQWKSKKKDYQLINRNKRS